MKLQLPGNSWRAAPKPWGLAPLNWFIFASSWMILVVLIKKGAKLCSQRCRPMTSWCQKQEMDKAATDTCLAWSWLLRKMDFQCQSFSATKPLLPAGEMATLFCRHPQWATAACLAAHLPCALMVMAAFTASSRPKSGFGWRPSHPALRQMWKNFQHVKTRPWMMCFTCWTAMWHVAVPNYKDQWTHFIGIWHQNTFGNHGHLIIMLV